MPKIKVHSGAAKRFKKPDQVSKENKPIKDTFLQKCRQNLKDNLEEPLH